jgi:hypothetical protein
VGKGTLKLAFATSIPTLPEIQAAFFKLTGMPIHLTARLSLVSLTTNPATIALLLQQDALSVSQLNDDFAEFCQIHPQHYEQMAAYRDNVYKKKLSQFNHIADLQLTIPGFYDIDFTMIGHVVEIEWYVGQYYGIICLEKVLIDLGGDFLDSSPENADKYAERYRKLKPWHKYKWYNRPRK